MNFHYLMNKLSPFLFALAISNQITAQTIPALISPNFKYGEIYYGESDSAVAYDEDWREVCRKLGLQLTKVPGGKFCEYKSTNPLYLWLGDICLDGSYRFSGRGQHCDQDMAYCPDSSWTLSADQKTCYRPNNFCDADMQFASEEQLLAALTYGEASTKNDSEEMMAIASATIRAMHAYHAKSLKAFLKRYSFFSYAVTDKNERYKLVICADSEFPPEAYKAALNAIQNGKDYANGGCFWDGRDLKTKGSLHKKYIAGFHFTRPEHNIYNATEPPARVREGTYGTYRYTYESTAAHGGTVFWKLSQEFLDATGNKQCQ